MFASNKKIKQLEETLTLAVKALEVSEQRQIEAENIINQQNQIINQQTDAIKSHSENLNICLQALNEHKTAIETLNQWALANKDAHNQLTHELMGVKEIVDRHIPAIEKNTNTIVGFDEYLHKVQGLLTELEETSKVNVELDYAKIVDEFDILQFSQIASYISISELADEVYSEEGFKTIVSGLVERFREKDYLVPLARQIALDAGLTDRVVNKIVSRLAFVLMSPTDTQPTWVAPIRGTQYPTDTPFNPLQPSFTTCANSDIDSNIS